MALLLALPGCRRAKVEPLYVSELRVSDATLAENPALQLDVQGLREQLREALLGSKRFVPLAPGKEPSGQTPYLCKLEVAFTRESMVDEDGQVTKAEVGLLMEIWQANDPERLKVTGFGKSTFNSTVPSERVPAFHRALAQALGQAVESEEMQVAAIGKTDKQLIDDLSAADPRVRDFAVRILSDRKSPEAVPKLIERLSDPDREVALRAVGALGAIGDPRAVPALIEMTRQRDTQFLLSIVDVIATIGGPDAEGFLFTLGSGHPEEVVRRAALEGQERMHARAGMGKPPAQLPAFKEKEE